MSATIYNKGFSVELSHGFYDYAGAAAGNEFKVNKDLELVPTAECAALLRNGRMRFVRTGSGFTVFYQAYKNASNAIVPLVPLTSETEFVFAIRMRTDAAALLSNISDFDISPKTYTAGKVFLLDQTVDGSTSPSPVTLTLDDSLVNMLRPLVFGYTFSSNFSGGADIVVKRGATTVLTLVNVPYNAGNKTYSAEINLSGEAAGLYTLDAFETGTSNPLHSTDFYADTALAHENIFGLIRIHFDTSGINRLYDSCANVNDFISFEYQFAARSTTWRYYIIPQSISTTTYALGVIDGSGSPVVFNAVNPATVGQPYGIPNTTMKINGLNPVILESATGIAFSENVRTQIALFKKDSSNPAQQVLDGLSNALFTGVDSDRLGAVQNPPSFTPGISEIFVIV